MPRIRTMKPEIWTSSDFTALSPIGRLTFLCLISLADDAGRLKTDARHLAATYLHGIGWKVIDRQLGLMEQRGMVVRYPSEPGPTTCVALINWVLHQKIDHPTPSRIPPPPNTKLVARARALSRPSAGARADRIGSDRIGGERILSRAREGARETPPSNNRSTTTRDEALVEYARRQAEVR